MDKIRNTDRENACADVQQNIQSLPAEMQMAQQLLDDSLAVYQTKHIVNKQFINHTPWYSPKEAENFWSTQKSVFRCL